MNPTLKDVKRFWEDNPLFAGESGQALGSLEFFREHREMILKECLGGGMDPRILPRPENAGRVLDLGCGIGFWLPELHASGCRELFAADLTAKAVELARERCRTYGFAPAFSVQNAEELGFASGSFSHVNCHGVIHHTPRTEACLAEIARVLQPGGTASLSVYYRNAILKAWPALRLVGGLLTRLGFGLKGRGRETIFSVRDVNEIVRYYDGSDNPLGKCYARGEFLAMLEPHFLVEEVFFHFFPAKAFPFSLPGPAHRFLDAHLPFMLYVTARKR